MAHDRRPVGTNLTAAAYARQTGKNRRCLSGQARTGRSERAQAWPAHGTRIGPITQETRRRTHRPLYRRSKACGAVELCAWHGWCRDPPVARSPSRQSLPQLRFELGALALGQQAVGEFGAQFRDVVDVRHLVFLSSCEDESAHGVVSGRVKERGSDRRSRRVGEPKCASILGGTARP
jgi:hypothetical protein